MVVLIQQHREDAGASTISRLTSKHSLASIQAQHILTGPSYDEIFHTGVTREFWLEVVNTTLAPDGFLRPTMSFNGTLPGPAITADWGDDIVVHVTNTMANNGTVSQV